MVSLMGEEGAECLRVVVVGWKGVGKSSLAVRFLTKRFIGEYQESKGIDNTGNINDNNDMTSHAVLQADGHIWVADVFIGGHPCSSTHTACPIFYH